MFAPLTLRNHSIFWRNLAPTGSPQTKLDGASTLAKKINEDFGSFEDLKKQLNAATAGVQGSGWGWLVGGIRWNMAADVARVMTRLNKSLKSRQRQTKILYLVRAKPIGANKLDHVPILGIDIWEHA